VCRALSIDTQVEFDAEDEPIHLWLLRLALGHRLLEFDGSSQRLDSAAELEVGHNRRLGRYRPACGSSAPSAAAQSGCVSVGRRSDRHMTQLSLILARGRLPSRKWP